MAISGYVKVSSDELIGQANTVKRELLEVRNLFHQLKETMDATREFWTGEAADTHRNRYARQIVNIEKMFNSYQELVTDLESIAGVYKKAEQSTTNAADSLPMLNL